MSITFRVFVSSTFSDFNDEREALQARVFPALKEFAGQHGATFEPVDLRWGISPAAQHQHETLDICLEEVTRAQRVSPHVNFIVLLGQRYGWRPIPHRIPDAEWACLIEAVPPLHVEAIRACFRRDTNRLTEPEWLLAPSDQWPPGLDEGQLRTCLRAAAMRAPLEPVIRDRYFMSATHFEIESGALRVPDAGDHVTAYARTIVDLDSLVDRDQFTDVTDDGERDMEAWERLADLRASMGDTDNARSFREYDVSWSDPKDRERYLEDFVRHVIEDQKALMVSALQRAATTRGPLDANRQFAEARGRSIVGRTDKLNKIREYLRDPETSRPLLILGEGGAGKSAVMSAAYLEALDAPGHPVVLARFIGGAGAPPTLRHLVTELATTVAREYQLDEPPPIGPTIPDLVTAFADTLALGTEDRPLMVFLDALDQLSLDDWANEWGWIPEELPRHARLVMSARPEATVTTVGSVPDRMYVMELAGLEPEDGEELLRAVLAEFGRTVTAAQWTAVMSAFNRHRLPLWLVIAGQMCARMTSFDPPPRFPKTIDGLINRLVTDLEADERHGEVLVRRALAYLVASQGGLAEAELSAALGIDTAVRHEFEKRSRQRWEGSTLPPIVWARLRQDLAPYLTEEVNQGARVTRFFHREFDDLVRERFMGPLHDDDLTSHLGLVHAFRPPAAYNNWHQLVPRQPQDPATLRSLTQQPWHLALVGTPSEDLKRRFRTDPMASTWTETDLQLARAAVGLPLSTGMVTAFSDQAVVSGWMDWQTEGVWPLVAAELEGYESLEAAAAWWESHADQPHARNNLGRMAYDSGDLEGAGRLWGGAAADGHLGAMINLGFLALLRGDRVAQESWWVQAADGGSLEALLGLGHDETMGDSESRQRWLTAAADRGSLDAMMRLSTHASEEGVPENSRTWLLRAAELGHAGAMTILGVLLDDEDDDAGARRWWAAAADGGIAHACLRLGDADARRGEFESAIRWWVRSLDMGLPDAASQLSAYFTAVGDRVEAARWCRRGADMGHVDSMVTWAGVLSESFARVSSQAWQQRAADRGSTEAMCRLAARAWNAGDVDKAGELWRRAAEGGSGEGMTGLGHKLMADGDVEEAEECWRSAAALGNSDAMIRLGVQAWDGGDAESGQQWYQRAADTGSVYAMVLLSSHCAQVGDAHGAAYWLQRVSGEVQRNPYLDLAVLAEQSGGVQTAIPALIGAADMGSTEAMARIAEVLGESDEALPWLERGAKAGDPRAMVNFGVRLAARHAYEEALDWFERAARAGNPMAMANLGLASAAEDDVMGARAWFERARDSGHDGAQELLSTLGSQV